ncbi:hypothetical protein R3P38DRAFT_3343185 [Favolaschia claudopus]|uniref:Uncharacterized protein n=1 Tax=Favolaschia claudopus TaxID=2862362 RepID=A0AAW0DM43_9AGAR
MRLENIEREQSLTAPAKEYKRVTENQPKPSNRTVPLPRTKHFFNSLPHTVKKNPPNMQLTRSMASLFAVVSLAAATAVPRRRVRRQHPRCASQICARGGSPRGPAELVKQLRSVHCETSGGSPSTGDAQAGVAVHPGPRPRQLLLPEQRRRIVVHDYVTALVRRASASATTAPASASRDATSAMTLETDCSTSRTAALPAGALRMGGRTFRSSRRPFHS